MAFAQAAKDQNTGEAFGFSIENDSRNIGGPGSDQAYSNGFKFSYIFPTNEVPVWATLITDHWETAREETKKSLTNYGMSLGQQIYTPNDTSRTDYIQEDRPYAGWLYVGFAAHLKTPSHAQYLELDLGTIGPKAYGEKVQNGFHKMINEDPTLGWRNELKTEPTVQLYYQQRSKFFEIKQQEKRTFDAVPYHGFAFGNVAINAYVGGIARLGYDLPNDLGPTRPAAEDGDNFMTPGTTADEQRSIYGFLGLRGNAIARNIFLDGNTFRSGPHVKKYPFVTESEFGFGGSFHRWSVIWRFVTRSPEFEEKSRFNSFASITSTYYFK